MVEVTVKRALELAAARGGDQTALYWRDRKVSYSELDRSANCLANFLRQHGLTPHDRIAVLLPNTPEYVVVALACAKGRFVMLPMNYRYTGEECEFLLEDSGARAVIYDEAYTDVFESLLGAARDIVRVVRSAAPPTGCSSLTAVLQSGDTTPISPPSQASDLFYLGYTSGTTGRPKGAMVSQGNRALAYHYWALEFGLTEYDHGLHCGPFHHTAPFTFTLTQLFLRGAVTILPSFDAREALTAIARNGVTWTFMVPYMLDRIIELGEAEVCRHNLSKLRTIISGASALPSRTKHRILELLPHVRLHEFYGATEAGVITNLRPEDQLHKTRCVGRPVYDMEVAIRRTDGTLAGADEVGDIWLRGPTLFAGYFGAEDKTKAAFDGDWCTIGDVGRIDEEGYLYIVDRSKDVIKSGGVNIFPAEIEEALLKEVSIADVAVVGVPDRVWGEAVHAVVVPTIGSHPDPEALRAACRSRVAGYKVPKSFEFRTELPRNANGKVLKRVLRDEFSDRRQSSASTA
jgi:fatty-acyl-CoA synthase/long-chain acyl-CoA synthetase